MKDLLKMINSDLKYIVRDLLEQGKSVSVGEIKDDSKGFHGQYVIKAKVGIEEHEH
ncbi:hypothetical protein [Halalkalibacter lacteus]|uniref:hypothetical protein n=1 Tax=Halalkalibacter lacteus TaxID=3090663 RepID=UPI002FC6BB7C